MYLTEPFVNKKNDTSREPRVFILVDLPISEVRPADTHAAASSPYAPVGSTRALVPHTSFLLLPVVFFYLQFDAPS